MTYVLDIVPNLAVALKCHTTHEVDEGHRIDRCTERLIQDKFDGRVS